MRVQWKFGNTVQRLLLFCIGAPLFALAAFYLPYYHHAVIAFVIAALAGGSAWEAAKFFNIAGLKVKPLVGLLLGMLIPILYYIETFVPIENAGRAGLATIALGFCAVAVFAPFAFSSKENLPLALRSAAAYGFLLIYPGFLAGFIMLINSEPLYAAESICSFVMMTLGNDALAWLVGVTLGRHKGIVSVSPSKSIEGFAGGFAGSILAAVICRAIFPAAFAGVQLWALLGMAILVGAASISGDLFESALKRSVGVKDSGDWIPGRGGFLDSVDSMLFAAPVFYLLSLILGLFR